MFSAVTRTKAWSISPRSASVGSTPRTCDGIHRVGAGELGDGAVEGGAEEHRLPVRRHAAEDPVDLRLEAHVEHPVGLVEHERRGSSPSVDRPALDQVEEAAGRGDEDVRALRAWSIWRPIGRAAVDGRDRQPLRRGERRDVRRDLDRELARRDEDERAGRAFRGGGALDERQPEGERLARAGRRLGEDVEAGERVREDEILDREGMGDPLSASTPATGALTPSS